MKVRDPSVCAVPHIGAAGLLCVDFFVLGRYLRVLPACEASRSCGVPREVERRATVGWLESDTDRLTSAMCWSVSFQARGLARMLETQSPTCEGIHSSSALRLVQLFTLK